MNLIATVYMKCVWTAMHRDPGFADRGSLITKVHATVGDEQRQNEEGW